MADRAGGHYPAPPLALDAIRRGTAASLAEGQRIEARHFGELAASEVSRALVSLFLATQQIKKDAGYPEGTEARQVKKVAVIGAGLMGSGIAAAAADAGAADAAGAGSRVTVTRVTAAARAAAANSRKSRDLRTLIGCSFPAIA